MTKNEQQAATAHRTGWLKHIMVSTPKVTYRDVREPDFSWLLQLRKATMDPHLIASGFNPEERSHIEAVQQDYEWARIIRIDDEDAGMIKLVKNVRPWHLRHIQVLPAYQGMGIGQAVMLASIDAAKLDAADIVLNVLKVNPAQGLYRRLGFTVVDETDTGYKMLWSPDDMRRG